VIGNEKATSFPTCCLVKKQKSALKFSVRPEDLPSTGEKILKVLLELLLPICNERCLVYLKVGDELYCLSFPHLVLALTVHICCGVVLYRYTKVHTVLWIEDAIITAVYSITVSKLLHKDKALYFLVSLIDTSLLFLVVLNLFDSFHKAGFQFKHNLGKC